jgi:hypothetical protein
MHGPDVETAIKVIAGNVVSAFEHDDGAGPMCELLAIMPTEDSDVLARPATASSTGSQQAGSLSMMKPAFQPAPRPRPRISPEDAQQLAVATRDLGFTRPSSAPEARAEEPVQPVAEPVPSAAPAAQEPKAPLPL